MRTEQPISAGTWKQVQQVMLSIKVDMERWLLLEHSMLTATQVQTASSKQMDVVESVLLHSYGVLQTADRRGCERCFVEVLPTLPAAHGCGCQCCSLLRYCTNFKQQTAVGVGTVEASPQLQKADGCGSQHC